MRNIAFKRAKSIPNTKGILPPELIIEYVDSTLQSQGFYEGREGYDILSEELFAVEFEKNAAILEAFLAVKASEEKHRHAQLQAIETRKLADEKLVARELIEFRRWKESKKSGR